MSMKANGNIWGGHSLPVASILNFSTLVATCNATKIRKRSRQQRLCNVYARVRAYILLPRLDKMIYEAIYYIGGCASSKGQIVATVVICTQWSRQRITIWLRKWSRDRKLRDETANGGVCERSKQ